MHVHRSYIWGDGHWINEHLSIISGVYVTDPDGLCSEQSRPQERVDSNNRFKEEQSDVTIAAWRKRLGQLEPADVKRLRQLKEQGGIDEGIALAFRPLVPIKNYPIDGR
jgi:hypothetical protein